MQPYSYGVLCLCHNRRKSPDKDNLPDSSLQSKHGKQERRWLDPNCMTPFLPFGPLPLIVFILLLQILFHHFEEKQQIATRASLRPVFNVVRRPAQRGLRCAERDWIRPLMLTGPDTNNAAFHSPHPVVINLLKTFSTTCFFRPPSTAARKGPEGCRVDHEQERERERQFQWTFLIFCPLELPQKKTFDTAAQSSDSLPVCWC